MKDTFKFLYKKILKPILFLMDPEFVHDRFIDFGELLGKTTFTRKLIARIYGYQGKDISKTVDGITYKTPILLSAGFDYNARLTNILDCMSFGGEEVGSVTFRPSMGNTKPRLTRAIKSNSIVVYKGLRNDGVEKIITRLKTAKAKQKDFAIGVSIARTNDELTATDEAGIEDYYNCMKRLVEENVGDFYTINISCPNAFRGESFGTPERLDMLLSKLNEIKTNKPRYVKMPINVEWEKFKPMVDVVLKYKFNGVIIGNLNKHYEDLDYRDEAPKEYRGGLSGKPCQKLSTELIRKTRAEFGRDITIFGVGGILSVEDAKEKFDAGADLVMLITGMIFEGPHLMREIGEQVSNRE